MKGHWSRVNIREALRASQNLHVTSVLSFRASRRFTRDQCPFISKCKKMYFIPYMTGHFVVLADSWLSTCTHLSYNMQYGSKFDQSHCADGT